MANGGKWGRMGANEILDFGKILEKIWPDSPWLTVANGGEWGRMKIFILGNFFEIYNHVIVKNTTFYTQTLLF